VKSIDLRTTKISDGINSIIFCWVRLFKSFLLWYPIGRT